MNHTIILEGCDKTGKTTLANKLAELTGYQIVHLGPPKTKNPYLELLGTLICHSGEGVIFDRFHWGEKAYAGITKPRSLVSIEQFESLEEQIEEMNGVVIYCYDEPERILKRFKEDGEDLIPNNLETIEQILDNYREVIKMSSLEIRPYNFNKNKDITYFIQTIMQVKNRIRFYRIQKGLRQFELGNLIGAGRLTVAAHERGEREIRGKYIEPYCKALEITPNELFDF